MLNFPVYKMPHKCCRNSGTFPVAKRKEEPRAADVTLSEKTVNMLKDDRGISFGDKSTFLAHFFERN